MRNTMKGSVGLYLVLLMGACTGARTQVQAAEPLARGSGVSQPGTDAVPAAITYNSSHSAALGALYRLEPGDTLTVEAYPDKEFTRDVVIDESGAVHLPLVGTVYWAGKTVFEAMTQLDALLRGTYYRDPKVIISVSEFRSSAEKVYVFGQVKNPGAFNYKQGVTLLRAIALAGGFTDVAKDQSVELLRKRASAKQNEEREHVDIKDVIRGKIPDPVLEPDDVVVVPESFF